MVWGRLIFYKLEGYEDDEQLNTETVTSSEIVALDYLPGSEYFYGLIQIRMTWRRFGCHVAKFKVSDGSIVWTVDLSRNFDISDVYSLKYVICPSENGMLVVEDGIIISPRTLSEFIGVDRKTQPCDFPSRYFYIHKIDFDGNDVWDKKIVTSAFLPLDGRSGFSQKNRLLLRGSNGSIVVGAVITNCSRVSYSYPDYLLDFNTCSSDTNITDVVMIFSLSEDGNEIGEDHLEFLVDGGFLDWSINPAKDGGFVLNLIRMYKNEYSVYYETWEGDNLTSSGWESEVFINNIDVLKFNSSLSLEWAQSIDATWNHRGFFFDTRQLFSLSFEKEDNDIVTIFLCRTSDMFKTRYSICTITLDKTKGCLKNVSITTLRNDIDYCHDPLRFSDLLIGKDAPYILGSFCSKKNKHEVFFLRLDPEHLLTCSSDVEEIDEYISGEECVDVVVSSIWEVYLYGQFDDGRFTESTNIYLQSINSNDYSDYYPVINNSVSSFPVYSSIIEDSRFSEEQFFFNSMEDIEVTEYEFTMSYSSFDSFVVPIVDSVCTTHIFQCYGLYATDPAVCSGFGDCVSEDFCQCVNSGSEVYDYVGLNCEIRMGKMLVLSSFNVLTTYFEIRTSDLLKYYGIHPTTSTTEFFCGALIEFAVQPENDDGYDENPPDPGPDPKVSMSGEFTRTKCRFSLYDGFISTSGYTKYLHIFLKTGSESLRIHHELCDKSELIARVAIPDGSMFQEMYSNQENWKFILKGNSLNRMKAERMSHDMDEAVYNQMMSSDEVNDMKHVWKVTVEYFSEPGKIENVLEDVSSSSLCKGVLSTESECVELNECYEAESGSYDDVFGQFSYFKIGVMPRTDSLSFTYARFYFPDLSSCEKDEITTFTRFTVASCSSSPFGDVFKVYPLCTEDTASISMLMDGLVYVVGATSSPFLIFLVIVAVLMCCCLVNCCLYSCLRCSKAFLKVLDYVNEKRERRKVGPSDLDVDEELEEGVEITAKDHAEKPQSEVRTKTNKKETNKNEEKKQENIQWSSLLGGHESDSEHVDSSVDSSEDQEFKEKNTKKEDKLKDFKNMFNLITRIRKGCLGKTTCSLFQCLFCCTMPLCSCCPCYPNSVRQVIKSLILFLLVLVREVFQLYFSSASFVSSSDVDRANPNFVIVKTLLNFNESLVLISIGVYVVLLFSVLVFFIGRFFVDPVMFCLAYCALREWIYYRCWKSIFLVWFFCMNLWCYCVKFTYLDKIERGMVLGSWNFYFEILVPELLLLYSLYDVNSYNGVSTNLHLIRLKKLSCFKFLSFPVANLGYLKLLKSTDSILEDYFQVLSIAIPNHRDSTTELLATDDTKMDEIKRKIKETYSKSNEYGHLPWDMIKDLRPDELIYLKDFFFPKEKLCEESYLHVFNNYSVCNSDLKWVKNFFCFPCVCVFSIFTDATRGILKILRGNSKRKVKDVNNSSTEEQNSRSRDSINSTSVQGKDRSGFA